MSCKPTDSYNLISQNKKSLEERSKITKIGGFEKFAEWGLINV